MAANTEAATLPTFGVNLHPFDYVEQLALDANNNAATALNILAALNISGGFVTGIVIQNLDTGELGKIVFVGDGSEGNPKRLELRTP